MEKFNAKILMLEERISQFKTEEERRRFFLENPEEVYKEMKHKIEEGQLKSITIPFYMQRIVESAFKECKSLKKIEIPSSVTYIGESVFDGCSSLFSIIIPLSVAYIGNFAF